MSNTTVSSDQDKNIRSDYHVIWTPPATSSGWLGKMEEFFGPGKTKSESTIEAVALLVVSTVLYLNYKNEIANAQLATWQLVVLIILALDLVGGIITNSTNAAKRSYHKNPSLKGRLIFIGLHNLHLITISLCFLDYDLKFFFFNSLSLLLGALAIEKVQIHTKRPLAMLLFLTVVGVHSLLFQMPKYLVLFPALFYLKLFVCFLVAEVPAYGNQSRK